MLKHRKDCSSLCYLVCIGVDIGLLYQGRKSIHGGGVEQDAKEIT
jgi:hypothetical protein